MNRFVYRQILFPVHELIKGHDSVGRLRDLERTQWLSPGELAELQNAKLLAILQHAVDSVPYYRRILPRETILRSQVSLANLPLLSKDAIRKNLEAFRSQERLKLLRSNTSGSTGEPLIFYESKRRISADVATKRRASRWWQVDIGDPEVVIWGAPVDLNKQDRLRSLRDRVFRTRLLSAFDMGAASMSRYLAIIRKVRPRQVFGYPTSIHLLCRFARSRGVRLDDLGVHIVFTTGECLHDDLREEISETFGAPVANNYGSRDIGPVAHECPEGRMHIASENVALEAIDDFGNGLPPGHDGELVITHLESYGFPFIRYRTGDIGSLSDERCPCGRGLPVLQKIVGRTSDFVVTPEGKIMHGLSLMYIIRDLPGVERFQIIQEDFDRIYVRLIVDERFPATGERDIREGFARFLGSGVRVEIDFVSEIPLDSSGKHRYVISRIPRESLATHLV